MSNDAILIEALTVSATIGVHAWERQRPRPLVLDIEMQRDLRPAGASDALADTIDYQAVADTAAAVAAQRPYALVEAFADTLARRLLEDFGIQRLRLTVHKPGAVPTARNISVRIERVPGDYSDTLS